MSSLNRAEIIGHLGKDPEVRYTGGGQAVANFTVATEEQFKDRGGEKQKRTTWHNIVVWGPAVENFVAKFLYKGDLVYLEGRIQNRQWEDKRDGTKKYTTEIVVTDIKKLSGKDGNSSNSGSKSNQQRTQRQNTRQSAPEPEEPESANEINDEDIPF